MFSDHDNLSLFTPTELSDSLRMPDAVVEPDPDHCVTLVLENHGFEPLRLGKGRVIGSIKSVTLEPEVELGMETVDRDGCMAHVSAEVSTSSQHEAQLLEQLNLQLEHLTPPWRQELTDLILHYAGVFAWDPGGLGGRDWDQRLPYVLFAYRASAQQSTQESPFYLLYGRDARLPMEAGSVHHSLGCMWT